MGVIDYVVPMVFHVDSQWREDYQRVGGAFTISNTSFVRYRSWGTEELLVRAIRKNMPFVRDIIILLSRESQRREWMTGKGLRVVYHHEFIPDCYLPTFNSRAIEMFLHKIPGLSERFLYANDDMYPLSRLKVTDFFRRGKPCLHIVEKPYPSAPNGFQQACMSGLNFVAKEFGMSFGKTWLRNGHSVAPILKSTCEHLWEIGGEEIKKSISPFRLSRNFNQYIYTWWQYLSGEYIDYAPPRKYVDVKSTTDDVATAIREGTGIVCVNDNECVSNYKAYAHAVALALEERINS